ncbi:uncharacterized protein LOC108106836 [Drosophila eugracilis]|uniref:uncharacterized protein LOC108106836 n=1 Tax=Drosophila eugracilis TaxID=29029 RepID=UPI0007E711F1|nr:uncharacterized protein LOC108106836 [Drosophila eugracilis]
MMSIVDLNNRCLLKIVEHLDLEEQLILWDATEFMSRLNNVISSCWHSRTQHFLHGKLFLTKDPLLHEFLNCISSTVMKLSIEDFSIDQMSAFRSHRFPKLRELSYLKMESYVDDIEILMESPNQIRYRGCF